MRLRTLRRLALVLPMAVAFDSAAGHAQVPVAAMQSHNDVGTAPSAPQLYFQNCAACHGPRGEGRICPQLAARNFAADAFASQVRGGGKAMPAFPPNRLTDAQVQQLLGLVNAFPTPPSNALPPAPSTNVPGAQLYTANCAMCHGDEGRGAMGPGILNTPTSFTGFTQQVHNGGKTMPPFPKLSDTDIRKVYEYLHPAIRKAQFAVMPGAPNYPLAGWLLLLVIAAVIAYRVFRRQRAIRVFSAFTAEEKSYFEQVQRSDPNSPVRVHLPARMNTDC